MIWWQVLWSALVTIYLAALPWIVARLAARRVMREMGLTPDVVTAIRETPVDPVEYAAEAAHAQALLDEADSTQVPPAPRVTPDPPAKPLTGSVAARVRRARSR